MATRDDLSKILGRVRALIERADHANTPVPEASACRAKIEGRDMPLPSMPAKPTLSRSRRPTPSQ